MSRIRLRSLRSMVLCTSGSVSTNPETRLRPLLATALTTAIVRALGSLRRNVQVFLAVASEPKNIILTRAREVAPPEGIAGARTELREGARCMLSCRVRDSWRGQGANWGNLLGGATWRTSNMADFVAATKKAKRDFSLRSE